MNAITTTTSLVQNGTTFVAQMAEQFRGYARKTAESFLEMARVVAETKRHAKDEEFTTFCQLIGQEVKSSTIRKFVTMGDQYPRLIKHANILPANWTTLYEVARVDSLVIDAHIATGAINPALTCAELKRLLPNVETAQPATVIKSVPFGTNAKFHAVFTHKLTMKEQQKLKQLLKMLNEMGAEVQIEYPVVQQPAGMPAKKPKSAKREKHSTASLVEFLDSDYVAAFDESQNAFSITSGDKQDQLDRYKSDKKWGSDATNTLEEHFV